MSKGAGSNRASKWNGNIYNVGDTRYEYNELPDSNKNLVKAEKKLISKEMYAKLKNVSTPQVIDNNKKIEIYYSSYGIKHFLNDAMVNLSGKYFSKDSMMRINEILEKSTYIPTSHEKIHTRTDGRDLWFSYQDADGRGVYFKVNWNNNMERYELYSVVDRI